MKDNYNDPMDTYPYRNQGRRPAQEKDSIIFSMIAMAGMALLFFILLINN